MGATWATVFGQVGLPRTDGHSVIVQFNNVLKEKYQQLLDQHAPAITAIG